MIVMLHLSGRYDLPSVKFEFAFGHGVSFFYVLSGFILTWVYYTPEKTVNLKKFFKKRFLRLWPLHIATVIAVILFIPVGWEQVKKQAEYLPFLLTMTQSWLGMKDVALMANGPAWSISTEFGFYLLFPLMLKYLDRIYLIFAGIFAATILTIILAMNAPPELAKWLWEALHVHPLGRLMEFAFGMCVGKFFINAPRPKWTAWQFSLVEIGAIALIVWQVSLKTEIMQVVAKAGLDYNLGGYLNLSGAFFAFGLLIWACANERGIISKLMDNKFLVLLGEISFSLYMIHQIVNRYFLRHPEIHAGLPGIVTAMWIVIIALILSYLAYMLVEIPFQKLAHPRGSGVGTVFGRKIKEKPVIAALASLPIVFVLIGAMNSGYRGISNTEMQAFKSDSIVADLRPINVDVTLTHYRVREDEINKCFEMLWTFNRPEDVGHVRRTVEVPLVYRRRNISDKIIVAEKSWDNEETGSIDVMDKFCVRNSYFNRPMTNPTIGIALMQRHGSRWKRYWFKEDGERQSHILIDFTKPREFVWLEKQADDAAPITPGQSQ